MTDADEIMHPHFETDATDIRIRIRIWINQKIRIRIPDHLCFKFWRWRRLALCECSCFVISVVLCDLMSCNIEIVATSDVLFRMLYTL